MTEFDEHFRRLADGTRPRHTFDAHADRDFAAWQRSARAALVRRLKLPHARSRLLGVEVAGVEDAGDHIREYVRLRTEPDLTVPAYLLLPKRVRGRAPGVLALHGHGPGKSVPAGLGDPAAGERDYALQAVRRGCVALAPDLRGMGEMMAAHDVAGGRATHSCQIYTAWANFLGYTAMGMRMHDLRCCLDFLAGRPDVDGDRLWVVGHSGGGMCAVFLAAIEARVRAVVASGYVCRWRRSLMDMDHCACNYVPGLYREVEMPDLLGLIAPRPTLIVAGHADPLFPFAGAREAYEQAARMYAAAGAAGALEFFGGEGGHRFYAARVWPWLLGLRAGAAAA